MPKHCATLVACKTLFDAEWYLSAYPDVAKAGMDPWLHFSRHGIHEQRHPCPLQALSLEDALWRGETSPALADLQALLSQGGLEGAVAGWVLARWHASHGHHDEALAPLQLFFAEPRAHLVVRHAGPFLLQFSLLFHLGKLAEATAWLGDARWPATQDLALARLMLPGNNNLAELNQFFSSHQLSPVCLAEPEAGLTLDNLSAGNGKAPKPKQRWFGSRPLVSVIMPCHNAAATLPTALRSLQQQTWPYLEILVVDDASTDGSAELVAELAAADPRIKLLRHSHNLGAYAARNTGLAAARGRYITTHDSDDWSHPQKIALHVAAMLTSRKVKASLSYLIRCNNHLHFDRWRMEESWISKNLSSLMFRRSVLKKIGYWDNVAVSADTEFYSRLLKYFGQPSCHEVKPGIPLTFARVNLHSLTQQHQTHLRTQFLANGLRRHYHQAAMQWHVESSPKKLYLSANPDLRPFPVPHAMCRGNERQKQHNLTLLAQHCGLFDASWYLRRYPDVAAARQDPWQHYLRHGHGEGRDPGPLFSTSGYHYQHPSAKGQNPLLHLQEQDDAHAYRPPRHQGAQQWHPGRPVLLLCAHEVTAQCYGAERSLLDVLHAFNRLQYNVVVALPSALSPAYVDRIKALSQHFIVLPYHWWRGDRAPEQATITQFTHIILQFGVNLVYCNTLTLLEPLLAAKEAGVTSVTHVRELPEHDAPLCGALAANAQEIRRHLLATSDYFIANSQVVARYLDVPERVSVVANTINAAFNLPFPGRPRLQLGMISSNLPKKGLADFVRLAAELAARGKEVDCVLVGPENEHTHALLGRPGTPANLTVTGYVPSAQEAVSRLDIVVNLSHFQESFGRTVLEAMAAARPVVCYHWGALSELVVHEKTGYLVPLGEVAEVTERVSALLDNAALRQSMGQAGRARATDTYGIGSLCSALDRALQPLLGHHFS